MGTHVNDTDTLTLPAQDLKEETVKHNFKENGVPSMDWGGGRYVLELGNWGCAPQEMILNEEGAGDNLKAKHPRQWNSKCKSPGVGTLWPL